MKKEHVFPWLWDLWCVISIIGIWPRFIEPRLITTTKLNLKIDHLPEDLKGLKILQFNDLHLSYHVPSSFLKKLSRKIKEHKPDIIVFLGDFLCYSKLEDEERLKQFLCSCEARYGCFAVLGNHDYEQFVSINNLGEYDVQGSSAKDSFLRAFKRLFNTINVQGKTTERASQVGLHEPLLKLLKKTPFKVLHNETIAIKINSSSLNICGLGEYMLKKCQPEVAFKNYEKGSIGVVLSHNPDSVSLLRDYPGEIILSGHTHGGQINLPWFWKKFTLMENMEYKSGLKKVDSKWLYVNRGVGSILPFRWFSSPEITLITLESI